jgi:hypothetical protein
VKPRQHRHRAFVIPLLVILVGAVLAIVLTPASAPDNSDPSSYATGNDGTYALYQLVGAVGGHPQRLSGSGFASSLRSGSTLVEAAPSTAFSPGQVRGLLRFARAGGTVLYALDRPTIDAPVLAALGLRKVGASAGPSWRERLPLGGGPELVVETGRATEVVSNGGNSLPVLGPSKSPVASVESLGLGRVVVLGSEAPISNRLLRDHGDGQFALLALRVRPGSRVLFDEIHHGYTAGDGVGELLLGTPLGLAAVLAAAVLLLFLISSGRRLGRPLPPPELVSRRSTDDHLDALAELYARTGDQRALAARYLEELRASGAQAPLRSGEGGDLSRRLRLLTSELEAAAREPLNSTRLRQLARASDAVQREIAGEPSPDHAAEVRQR